MRSPIRIYMAVGLIFTLWSTACNQSSHQEPSEVATETGSNETLTDAASFNLNDFQQLVDTYEDPARSEWQNPGLIMEMLGDLDDRTIADIGAGTGYFTFRLAAEGAKVIAIDIDERFLEYIEQRKAELHQANKEDVIVTRLSLDDDPLLEDEEIDHALLVNTYYFLKNPVSYLRKVHKGLKSTGRLIIVDYHTGNIPVGPATEFRVDPNRVKKELEQAGFGEITIDENALKYQYLITANKL